MKEPNDAGDAHRAIQEVAVRHGTGRHLEPEEIANYHNGRLSPEDERWAQDHLVACRECSELLIDLQNFGDPAFGSQETLPDRAGERVWEGVRKEIQPPDQPPNVVPFRRERRDETPRWLRSLAAMLVLSTMALSGWVASLRDRVKELSGPQANTAVVDLYPVSSVRGGTGGPPVPALPEDAGWVTVILRSPGLPEMADYGVEVLRADGSLAWKKDGLKPAFSSFSLSLPRDWIGDVRIRLVGIGPKGERRTIGEYALPKGP
jgi:hypothetical protein